MKIHTDTLTLKDLQTAANRVADVRMAVDYAGSRKRANAFEVRLAGLGERHTRADYSGRNRAATWHDWGWFIAELFKSDPDAIVGHYKSADHFHRATLDTFRGEVPPIADQRAVKVNAERNFDWGQLA